MIDKNGQKEIILKVVLEHQPVRTEQVKIIGMREGVSCADRYLRWLQADGLIVGIKEKGNRTKTWRGENPNLNCDNKTGQFQMPGMPAKPMEAFS